MTFNVEIGTKAPNVIETGSGIDVVLGLKGDDVINLHGGFDIVDGGKGNDIAYFDGVFSSFKISKLLGVSTVTGSGQTALLTNVERFGFTNGVYDVASKGFTANKVSVSGGGTVNEGGDLVFTFTRTGDLSRSYDATFAFGGSATAADFGLPALPGTITFAAGQSTATLTLRSVADGTYEGTEHLNLQLTSDGTHYAVAGSGTASGAIVDPAQKPSVGIVQLNQPVAEGGGVITLNFVRDGDLSGPLTVFFTAGPNANQPQFGTVTNADIVGGFPTSVTFAAGSSTASVSMTALDDASFEGFEAVRFTIQPSSAYAITPGSGSTVSGIVDNDPPPPPPAISLIVDNPVYPNVNQQGQVIDYRTNIIEGADLVFTFVRSGGDLSQPLTFNFLINDTFTGGSVLNEDFVLVGYDGPLTDTPQGHVGTLTFAAGSTTASIEIDILNDTATNNDGPTEQGFFIGVAPDQVPPTDYMLSQTGMTAIGVNVQDDTLFNPKPRVGVAPINVPVAENGGVITLNFVRDGDLSGPLTVFFTAGPNPSQPQFGTVTAADIVGGFPTSVTFAAGSTTASVSMTAFDDAAVEGFEAVRFTIQPNAAYEIGGLPNAFASAVSGITDNDSPPPPAIISVTANGQAQATVTEGSAVEITFTRSGDLSQALTVQYNFGQPPAGGAAPGSDFILPAGFPNVQFAAGQTVATLTIQTVDDQIVEGPGEFFNVNLSPGNGYVGAPNQFSAAITIQDNDTGAPPPVVSLVALDSIGTETPDGTDFSYQVTRTGDLSQDLTVFYTIVPSPIDGAEPGGIDLDAGAGQQSIVIPAGQASALITFDAVDDVAVENLEGFAVRLDNGPNYVLSPTPTETVAGGTLIDNDAVPQPLVTVSTTTLEVPELDGSDILFVFNRSGDTSQDLTVNYSLVFFPAGGAQYGVDYVVSPSYSGAPIQEGAQFTNQITIAAGQSSAVLAFDVIGDNVVENNPLINQRGEVVQINLNPGDYDRAEPAPFVQSLIVDNDFGTFLV